MPRRPHRAVTTTLRLIVRRAYRFHSAHAMIDLAPDPPKKPESPAQTGLSTVPT